MTNTMPVLTVSYGSMPETNGKSNWTAILHRKGECISTGITIGRSEYPDRVRYEADRMRYLIGELQEEPDILTYDANKHSGYVYPAPPVPALKLPEKKPLIDKEDGNDIDYMEPIEIYELGKADGFNKAITETERLNGVNE